MPSKKKESCGNEEKALVKFLKQTSKGKYAKIEKTSFRYSRIKTERIDPKYPEEQYYYTVS